MPATKIALVGIGKIARDQHIPAIAASDAWKLAAVASRNAGVAGVPSYTSLSALLAAHPEIACISLCTPPGPRFADAQAALAAGRHVMLEKPPGATLSEVHALQDLAAAKGLSLYATWHSREAAAVAQAKAWLKGKKITKVRVVWKEDVRRWHPGQDWIWQPGGLGVFDPGINALSVLTEILPEPVHLKSAVLEFPENRDTPIAAELRFQGGQDADIAAEFDWRQEGPQSWDIHLETTKGLALLADGGAVLTLDRAAAPSAADATAAAEYPALYAKFATLVAQGRSDVDLAPMRHVADAFTLGQRKIVAAFDW